MRCRIEIVGAGGEPVEWDPGPLQRVVDAALAETGLAPCLLCVLLVDDRRSGALHAEHFGDSQPTDVMSFPDGSLDPGSGLLRLGDLAVNTELAAREAERRRPDLPVGRAAQAETILYILHGLLHLLGYDDRLPADRGRMWARQRELLATVGIDLEEDPS